ncbi:MAG: hypothetical protein EXR91_00625 [Gemmatimonadetes bacterium]|nr:hypothetical protein [Gemmatimonadota bacterium]
MSPRPLDTTPEAWAVYNAALDRMSGGERVRVALELSDAVRDMRLAGLRARHPDATHDELIRRVVLEDYGIELPAIK